MFFFFFIAKLADSISVVAFWQAKNINLGMNCALEGLGFSLLWWTISYLIRYSFSRDEVRA